ncbi:MAG: hypothetical protein OHK0013_45460 [Sandaracinaceae bacterium]
MALYARALAVVRAGLVGLALTLVIQAPQALGTGKDGVAEAQARRGSDRRAGQSGARVRSVRGGRRAARRRPVTRGRALAQQDDPGHGSLSVGRPNRGRLVRGVRLEPTEHLAIKSSSADTRFGTAELVGLLGRVAARVAERAPGGRLHVGDLSREGGGRFGPHRSHRSGRDADVGFYLLDGSGSSILTDRFHDIRRDGTSRQDPSIRLDEARTWHLVEALITDEETPVQFIFLARHLEERLLAEGRRQGASEELLARADAVIDGDRQHTNHMHVRIYCPLDDVPRCDEEPPFHAWVDRSSARAAMAQARAAQRGRGRAAQGHVRTARVARTHDGGARAARGSSAAGAR